jgi:hypothetical protein
VANAINELTDLHIVNSHGFGGSLSIDDLQIMNPVVYDTHIYAAIHFLVGYSGNLTIIGANQTAPIAS